MTAASLLGLREESAPSDRQNRTQARFGRGNLARLIAIMAAVALVGTGIATGLLYNTAFDTERIRLAEILRSQVSLIEAVAKFDARFSGGDHDQGAAGATISQIQEAHRGYRGLRESGEFHLARRQGDGLEYLLDHQRKRYGAAAPMLLALAGGAGTMVTRGHEGEEILAAYEPVPSLNLGMVALVSLREIRAPFIKAATISGAVTLILILLGAIIVHRVNGSLIQRLHKSVADLNTAQRIANIGHWDWNIQTGRLHWTDEIYRIFGWEPQAFAANYDAFLETIHPDDRAAVVAAVDGAVKEDARYDIEHRIVQPGGQVRTVHEHGEVTRARDGTPIHMTGTVHDITVRKLAENQVRTLNEDLEYRVAARTREFEDANNSLQETLAYLSQAQEQLVEAEKMASLGGLVAGVAHEINTPVGIGVTAASHLHSEILRLRQSYQRGEMKRSELESFFSAGSRSSEIILANLRRAAELIRSFKQVAVDQSCDQVRRFNLRSYLDEVVTSLGPNIRRSGHSIEVACPDSIDIDGHPGALAQIVTNLVTNSLAHAYDDGQSGRLHISARREDDRIHLVYRDDGKGIPEQNLPRIFEPFFTTRRGQGGSGLGLNITYNLATQTLRGSIACTSTLGEGTEFRVSFPVELGERS